MVKYKKKKSVFRPQILEKKFLYFFKQHITNVFIRTCSWINGLVEEHWFANHSFHVPRHSLHRSFTLLLHDFMQFLGQELRILSFVWWLVTVRLPLDHVPEFFKGGSSLDIGLDVTRSWSGGPSSTPWFPLAAGYACSIVPLKKIQFLAMGLTVHAEDSKCSR